MYFFLTAQCCARALFLCCFPSTLACLAGPMAPGDACASAIVFDQPDDQTTLDVLLDGGSIQVGDQLFDNFRYSTTPRGLSLAPAPEAVVVTPLYGADLGLRLHALLADLPEQESGALFTDILLSFDVTAVGAAKMIAGAALMANPRLTGAGIAQVVETITAPGDADFGAQLMAADPAGPVAPQVSQAVTFKPQKKVSVTTGVSLATLDSPSGSATVSVIDQRFTQVAAITATPEPGTIGLLALVACLATVVYTRSRLG